MSSRGSFDNTGKTYDVSKIINLGDSSLNLFKYQGYSPLFLSTTFAISYGLSFASITGESHYSLSSSLELCSYLSSATITHTLLFFRKQIHVQARRSLSEQPDIHARLMSKYPQVPDWWYSIIFRTSS